MPGYNDNQLQGLVHYLATLDPAHQALINRVKAAFRAKPFSYGTQGKGGGGLRLGAIMADSINQQPANFPPGSRGYAFQTGNRQFVQRARNAQMMDMYYGDGGDVGRRADPDILQFVLYAAKLKVIPGRQNEWPWGTNTLANVIEHPHNRFAALGVPQAWQVDPRTTAVYGHDPYNHSPMTGTKELSRIIRWCVGEFGGTILFEGSEVYYNQVFCNGPRFGDTELEAVDLFQHFQPGSRRAFFGRNRRGAVEFQWLGRDTVPSKLLFLASWQFDAFAAEQWYKLMHPRNYAAPLQNAVNDPGAGPMNLAAPRLGGRVNRNDARAGDVPRAVNITDTQIDAMANALNIARRPLWNNFSSLPPGLAPYEVARWLRDQR